MPGESVRIQDDSWIVPCAIRRMEFWTERGKAGRGAGLEGKEEFSFRQGTGVRGRGLGLNRFRWQPYAERVRGVGLGVLS